MQERKRQQRQVEAEARIEQFLAEERGENKSDSIENKYEIEPEVTLE